MNAILVCKDCGSTNIKLVYCNATVVIGQRPDGEKFIINIEDYDDVQLCRCNSCGIARGSHIAGRILQNAHNLCFPKNTSRRNIVNKAASSSGLGHPPFQRKTSVRIRMWLPIF